MDKRKAGLWAATVLVIALVVWKLHTSHFDWAAFWAACRGVNWRLLILATLILYTNFLFRAARWAVFLKPALLPGKRFGWWQLAGSQFIGFAGLAALGRIGELIRPYLVSRRTGLPFSSQVAVVAVERIFDLGAFGVLFAGNLLLSPGLKALPYSSKYHLFGLAIAGIIVFLSFFVALVRFAGASLARIGGAAMSRFSRSVGMATSAKILEFRNGLDTIDSPGDFALATLYSLLTWVAIAASYIVIMRAFPAPVHSLTPAYAVLLLGFSVVGGVVQLPGIGGGAQLLTITALTVLFGIPKEPATSAGMILWAVTSMSVILPGLLFARAEQVSLSSVAREADNRNEPLPVH